MTHVWRNQHLKAIVTRIYIRDRLNEFLIVCPHVVLNKFIFFTSVFPSIVLFLLFFNNIFRIALETFVNTLLASFTTSAILSAIVIRYLSAFLIFTQLKAITTNTPRKSSYAHTFHAFLSQKTFEIDFETSTSMTLVTVFIQYAFRLHCYSFTFKTSTG